MKKIYLTLSVLFTVLTLAGAGYVLINHGRPGAGHAVVPMVFGLVFNMRYQKEKKKDSHK